MKTIELGNNEQISRMSFHGRVERALYNSAELLAERPLTNGRKDALYKHPTRGYIRYHASIWEHERPEWYRCLDEDEARDLYESFWDEDVLRPF